MGKILQLIRNDNGDFDVVYLSHAKEKRFSAKSPEEIVQKGAFYDAGFAYPDDIRADLEENFPEFLPMDKNGRFIWAGKLVRKTGTMEDYRSGAKYLVISKETLYIDGNPIGSYHTVNNYHSLELA